MRCVFVQQHVQICGGPSAGIVRGLLRIALRATWSSGLANESRQQNATEQSLDILRRFSSKGTMNSNKYIWLLLGGFAAMAFFVACQQQGSTTTTPAASSTRGVTEREVR